MSTTIHRPAKSKSSDQSCDLSCHCESQSAHDHHRETDLILADSKQPHPSSERSLKTHRRPNFGAFGRAFIAVFVMTAAALGTADAWAQASATDSGHRIAVIDIAYIYKNAPSIKAQIGKIEADLKNYDRELKQKREALQQAAAELTTLKVGTAAYAKQEEAVARMDSKLRLEMNRVRQELSQAEAKIYFDNYQRIVESVKLIAVHNGIHLVLRYTGETMDLEDDKSVARGLMKNVVYHEETLNLTKIVMQYLEQPGKAKPVSTASRKGTTATR